MTRLLEVLHQYLKEKGVTEEEFVERVIELGYGDRDTAEGVMSGELEPCVGISSVVQEILGLTDYEASRIRAAGMEDAREELGLLQEA